MELSSRLEQIRAEAWSRIAHASAIKDTKSVTLYTEIVKEVEQLSVDLETLNHKADNISSRLHSASQNTVNIRTTTSESIKKDHVSLPFSDRFNVHIKFINCVSGQYNRKIVFLDLETILRQKGLDVLASQTTENRRDTPIAVRVFDESMSNLETTIPIHIKITRYSEKKPGFNSQIIFIGLVETLRQIGHNIVRAERWDGGHGSDIAIRLRIQTP